MFVSGTILLILRKGIAVFFISLCSAGVTALSCCSTDTGAPAHCCSVMWRFSMYGVMPPEDKGSIRWWPGQTERSQLVLALQQETMKGKIFSLLGHFTLYKCSVAISTLFLLYTYSFHLQGIAPGRLGWNLPWEGPAAPYTVIGLQSNVLLLHSEGGWTVSHRNLGIRASSF